ncbi:MAG TPA: TIGR02466 family protein [Rhizomicrobium sp.]|nr:TIGR02466 family protein [Rhizomicrobium sp.]
MPKSQALFVTRLYQGRVAVPADLEGTCLAIAAEDRAGQRWSRAHGYGGYTSYASLNDLTRRASIFAALERAIARQVSAFASELQFELGGRKLHLDSLWINVMDKGAVHTPHIHPHAVISGTYYVAVPPRSGVIRFEDPRLAMMMAAPPKKPHARPENRSFIDVAPKLGLLLLWESWLRHGVETNGARGKRISVSFNYRHD